MPEGHSVEGQALADLQCILHIPVLQGKGRIAEVFHIFDHIPIGNCIEIHPDPALIDTPVVLIQIHAL